MFCSNNWHQRAFHETRPLTFLPQKALLFASSLQRQGLGVDLVSLKEWRVAKLMEATDAYWAAARTLALCRCLTSAGWSSWNIVTKHSKRPVFSPQCSDCARPSVSVGWRDYNRQHSVLHVKFSLLSYIYTVCSISHWKKMFHFFLNLLFLLLKRIYLQPKNSRAAVCFAALNCL